MAGDEAKEFGLLASLRAAAVYIGLFLVVCCGGAVFFMPFLLATNFCVSVLLIAQSLIRVGPFSRNGGPGGLLASQLARVQGLVQIGIIV